MDTKNRDQIPGIDALEDKAQELFSLMLSVCEDRIGRVPAWPDAHASSLVHAVMAVQCAINTFLILARIR